jgi:DtxR family transcriptional regulator, Mn-dependent transcriptional regulator
MHQETIENYLKTIYHLSDGNAFVVTNKELADRLNVIPATVTEAVKKLHVLKLVEYEKSYGTRLTSQGIKQALNIVRRHRIWETYLAQELGFGWDEVHELAEELEHIKSDKLVQKLAQKIGNPSYDPHGDPIPDEKGRFQKTTFKKLSEAKAGRTYTLSGVADHSPAFLKFLDRYKLKIGTSIKVLEIESFDGSMVTICNSKEVRLSLQVVSNLLVR